jgi:hypothetical protein
VADNSEQVMPVADLKTATDLTDMLDRFKKARQRYESDWKLNLSFYRGRQWTYISKSGSLESLPTRETEMPRYRVRTTVNKVTPGVQSVLSKLTKTKPIMSATPQSSSPDDVKAAQLAELLLEDWWVAKEMGRKLEEAILWSLLGGQGYWKISWDPNAGIPMTFTINPETGQPISNDKLVDLYKIELQKMGLPEDHSDQTVALGDVHIDVLSPFQVYLDDGAPNFEDCKVAVCEHSLTPDKIYDQFKVRVKPDAAPTEPDQALPVVGGNTQGSGSVTKSVKKVYFGYFVPTPSLPKGRYVVWCEDGEQGNNKDPKRDNILYDGPWPYPFNELPLVRFAGINVPGALYDDAVTTSAIPLQKTVNRTWSQLTEYKNLTLNPQVWAPIGSLKDKYTNEPGAVNQFQPVLGMKPEVAKPPEIPRYVFEMLSNAEMALDDIFGNTKVTEGTPPPNVEAGVAIDLLQEMSTDRLAPQVKQIETALARAGKYMLTLAQQYYVEERLLKIRGAGGGTQVKKFKGADISGGLDVIAESGSGLPRTRAGRQARIDSLVDRGVLPAHQAWKYYDLADMRSIAAKHAADEDQAYREHEKILQQEPLNQVAWEEAQQMVMQGLHPETGEPFQQIEEVQDALEAAALAPNPAENSATHLDIHHDFMVSVEFEGLPSEIQRAYYKHYELTQEKSRQEAPVPEGQSPRVSLSMHGTLGPTVASKIMKQAGVPAEPQEFMEQPLETLVMDSVDAPDRDEAANDPFTEEERLADLEMRASKHAAEMAKVEQSMSLEERKFKLAEAQAAAQRARPNGNK